MASAAEQLAANMNFETFSKATELHKRLWFTLIALIVYRLGTYIPIPGIDPDQFAHVGAVVLGADGFASRPVDDDRGSARDLHRPPRGSLEVVLTPAQRKRVHDVTGYKMETLIIRDESGVLSRVSIRKRVRSAER